jgi:3-oxoacyl-[acyl-carrier protein] reductase
LVYISIMNLSLENKYAVICGSTQGIGLATAINLANLGATCVLIARNKDSLIKAVKELPVKNGQQHSYAIADFTDTQAVSTAISTIVEAHSITILVNNSGGPQPGPITAATLNEFENAFTQHLLCNQILTNAVLPGMKTSGYGRIINLISTSVKTPLANLGVSNTIRAAVAAWAKTLSNEVGQYNITVNNVLPGLTATMRYSQLVENTAVAQNTSKKLIEESLINSIPMRRIGMAEEIANVIAFLASPAASYVNGTSIAVDGGRTAAF